MKIKFKIFIGMAAAFLATAVNAQTNLHPTRVGIYDSRAIAYAYFWSPAGERIRQEQQAKLTAAKAAGNTSESEKLKANIRAGQENNHRQVFSAAPVNDVLATIKDKVAEIQKEAGVVRLVSKWDNDSLKQLGDAEKVDITDRLVREFITPTEKQKKVLSDLLKQTPLSREKCEELIRNGKI